MAEAAWTERLRYDGPYSMSLDGRQQFFLTLVGRCKLSTPA